jgi:hypothetical protein
MRGAVAHRLRKSAYGKGTHPGQVGHCTGDLKRMGLNKNLRGCCVADEKRREYKRLKRSFLRREFVI